jgi:sarcosine oxidase subunit delta
MSFRLTCPNCGKRNVTDFTYGGEYQQRPNPDADILAWTKFVYLKDNIKGLQVEWWYCRSGCQRWFLCERDTVDNCDHRSFWFSSLKK